MSIIKLPALLAAAALGLAAPLAYAQDTAPSSVDETNAKDVPACSAKVTDHCMDKPGAHRVSHKTAGHRLAHHKARHHTAIHHAKAKTAAAAVPPHKAATPAKDKKS